MTLRLRVRRDQPSEESKPIAAKKKKPARNRMLDLVQASLDDDKAEHIVLIDLVNKASFADTLIIATGRSARQVGAMADHLREKLKAAGHRVLSVEGMPMCDWVGLGK